MTSQTQLVPIRGTLGVPHMLIKLPAARHLVQGFLRDVFKM